MNHHSNSEAAVHNLAQSVYSLSSLPCAPICDWTTQAAQALSELFPSAAFAVVVVQVHLTTLKVTTESSGVSTNPHHPAVLKQLESRSTLERLGSINPMLLQTYADHSFITTPQALLPRWNASDSSDQWRSSPPQQTLISYTPLTSDTTNDPSIQSTLALICIASPNPNSADILDQNMFAAAVSVLNHKACSMNNAQPGSSISWLTQREQAILDQLILGHSVREIADSIDRSPHTVHDHVKSLHKKLNASSRGELIAKALGYRDQSTIQKLLIPVIDPELLPKPVASEFIEPHPETRVRAKPLNH
jgi:DNA-binding CsgD family transcriptional regulator